MPKPQPVTRRFASLLALACVQLGACSTDSPTAGASSTHASDTAVGDALQDIGPAADTADTASADTASQDTTAADVATCKTVADCPAATAPCSQVACQDSLCVVGPRDEGAACATGDKCVLTARCKAGACVPAKVKDCDDGDPCTADGCLASGLCKHAPAAAGTACDDGTVCTKDDTCDSDGACVGGAAVCACESYEDCALADDGNPCNGSLYCRHKDGKCAVNPATVVVCDTSDDGPCQQTACAAALGACVTEPAASGTACEDGNPCTVAEACDAVGNCKPGKNVCACAHNADCAPLEDGNPCNGSLYCDTSNSPYACRINPSSLVFCSPGADKACLHNKCDPQTAACAFVQATKDSPCDDGDSCTAGDHCDQGACKAGTDVCVCQQDADCAAQEDGDLCNGTLYCSVTTHTCKLNPKTVVHCPTAADGPCEKTVCIASEGKCAGDKLDGGQACDDGNKCTTGGTCKAGTCVAGDNKCQCQSTADCASQEDGNACNGTLFCDKKAAKCVLNPATVISCPSVDDTTCLANTCVPAAGACTMTAVNENKACDADGSACTKGDRCAAGTCTPGTNICACSKDGDCESQEDGNACNGTLFCNKVTGGCELNPATVIVCKSVGDTICRKNLCEPKTGLCAPTPVHQGLGCEDGNPCTKSESCLAGKCQSGTNICACEKDADCAKQDDGDPCTAPLWCDKTGPAPKCAPNPAKDVACPPNKDTKCLRNTCDPKTGKCALTAVNHKQVCAPGTLCSAVQICLAGQCMAGKPLSCDDGNPCTADKCDDFAGCSHTPQTKIDCDDGNKCTSNDVCIQGFCTGSIADCNDNSPCTQDVCAPLVGCQYVARPGPCSDGDACSSGDVCAAGKCLAGKKVLCDDGNQCTLNACDPAVGCTTKPVVGKCDDGDPCTAGDSCKSGACLPIGPNKCDDGNACTDDVCLAKTGCKHWARKDGAACDDGDKCTVGDVCDKVVCTVKKVVCDDDNSCTVDSCSSKTGRCVFEPIKTAASCHGLGTCAQGDCVDTVRGRVRVPAGVFYMGCNGALDKLCAAPEEPQHKVELDAYWIDISEVSHATYKACVVSGACEAPVANVSGGVYGTSNTAKRPINGVNWAEAVTFCKWRGGRLPTEAEWEKAARGGCEKHAAQDCAKAMPVWPHGNSPAACPDVVVSLSGKHGCGNHATADVGARPKNASPYGVRDMAGNVMEWVHDVYDKTYYTNPPSKNPKGPAASSTSVRVRRGGGFASVANDVRASARNGVAVKDSDRYTGVRCAYDSRVCDDANPCTKDTVSAGKCVHEPASGPCDDGDGCTREDTCKLGKCAPGKALACDDNNVCTVDSCNKATGRCLFAPVADGTKCTFYAGGTCAAGSCVYPSRDQVLVPAGTFWMGCNPYLQSDCEKVETPAVELWLSPYWIDRHEVTAARYRTCVDAGACSSNTFLCKSGHAAPSSKSLNAGTPGRQNHPMNCVSWHQADAFCKWTGGRLPTEAEWEKAARGGCETRPTRVCRTSMPPHPWGTAALGCSRAIINTKADKESTSACGLKHTWPVGSRPAGASPYGVMDMTGNVEEWVADWGRHGLAFFKKVDPSWLTVVKGWDHKVIKGAHYGRRWHISHRGREKPSVRWNVTGFRCARDIAACDDGNDCTIDTGTAGKCAHKARTGSCDDGDRCTGAGTCAGTTCSKGKAIDCSDGDKCTADSCSAQTGLCKHVPLGGAGCG